jgi:hypothetical protein
VHGREDVYPNLGPPHPGLHADDQGPGGTTTSDYKRHGATTLFAALNALGGTVIGSCMDQHRHEEFLKFLRTVDREVPKALRFM